MAKKEKENKEQEQVTEKKSSGYAKAIGTKEKGSKHTQFDTFTMGKDRFAELKEIVNKAEGNSFQDKVEYIRCIVWNYLTKIVGMPEAQATEFIKNWSK